MFPLINGYVFHFGLAIIVFFLAPHILFFKDLIRAVLGFTAQQRDLRDQHCHDRFADRSAGDAFANPAQRIISTFDDWFSWLVTFLPVLTGVIATSHLGARYETLLGLHILSVSLFLVWLPFGKLMHFFLVFVTRSQTGAHLSHRGAQL